MVNNETIRTVVGIIGNVNSFFLFAAPMPTMWRIWKKKDAEEFDALPYIGAAMNCVCWVFYGLPIVHPDSTLVITINSVGLFLELCYLILMFVYGNKQHKKKISIGLALELVAITSIAACTLTLLHTFKRRSLIVGSICVVFGIIMYALPLGIMRNVIRTKSVEFMPFPLSLACFTNGLIWLVYALLKFDFFILFSNGVGAVLGAIQLILYAIYYKSTPKRGKDGKMKPSEVQLQTPV